VSDLGVRPRLGFLGVGWIGRDRMRAVAASGVAHVAAVADVDPAAARDAAEETGADVAAPDDLIEWPDLHGVVIATPSALHAEQSIAALRAGRAVFCQKPLGRDAAETAAVVEAARAADRLLGVDLSYRHLDATCRMRDVVRAGGIGPVFAASLTFHNAYGPDKPWFRDRALSGGGCVIDLGTHLVDLVRWMLPAERFRVVAAQLHAGGRPLAPGASEVEDHAAAQLVSSTGTSVTLACSWWLHAGCDAVIGAAFHGTTGSVELRNVGGSFYDFEAFLHRGPTSERLASPPDGWGGRATVSWADRLAAGQRADEEELDDLVEVAALVERIAAG
jgi:predicted dehydrogenase